jgi:cytochrome c biogenesis protein CcdA
MTQSSLSLKITRSSSMAEDEAVVNEITASPVIGPPLGTVIVLAAGQDSGLLRSER